MLAGSMAGYIQWLASRYPELQETWQEYVDHYRNRATQGNHHRRTPTIIANLAIGWQFLLDFTQDAGAIDAQEAEELWDRGWAALITAAACQRQFHAASDPVERFLELLSAAIASGKAHIANDDGGAPTPAQAWGWRERRRGSVSESEPQGERVGWIQRNQLYLETDAAYNVAQRLANEAGDTIPIASHTMRKRLREKDKLATTDERRGKIVVRRTLEGKRRDVLHLRRSLLLPQESAQSAQRRQRRALDRRNREVS
jgi:hypothetical protein